MKIQKVTIKDFKVIKNLEKEINGANIILLGENGVGKSTFMQAIEIALGNQNNIPPNASGDIELIVDKEGKEYKFNVKFKEGKPVITVTTPDGAKDSKKGFIAQIVGAIDFDVDEFVKMSDSTAGRKKQIELYKSLLDNQTVDELSQIEVTIKRHYDDRTELNGKIKMLSGFIKESKLFGDDLKVQKVDISFLQNELEQATTYNQKIDKAENEISNLKISGKKLADEKQRLLDRLSEIDADYTNTFKRVSEGEKWLSENKKLNTTEITEQINNASNINATYAEAQSIIEKKKQLAVLENQSGEYTSFIESGKSEIERFIKEMAVPVDGLYFNDEGLIYNGVDVSTASLSTSEIIHLGCKLKMAQNKDFGVLLIEHGESLGISRLAEIQKLAKENNWQIILEQVQRGTNELKIEIMADETKA